MRMKVTVEVEEDYETSDGKTFKRFTSVYEQTPWADDENDASELVRAIAGVVNDLVFPPSEPE